MHPSFEQFVASLRDPSQRAGIGLSISDDDAATLLTNAGWATDYYTRWVALFPAEAVAPGTSWPASAAPAASAPVTVPPAGSAPATVAAATSATPFGPPPTGAATQPFASAFPAAPVDAPLWIENPRRRWPAPARIALISVVTIAVLAVIGGVLNQVVAVTHAPVAAITGTHPPAAPSSDPTSPVQSDPVVFHGLTQTEYDLMEAVLAPQGHTLEEAVAHGTTDATLQQLAVNTESTTAKSCTDGEALADGFGNAAFRASFIAGYEVAQKATPEQSAAVYDALAAFCEAH